MPSILVSQVRSVLLNIAGPDKPTMVDLSIGHSSAAKEQTEICRKEAVQLNRLTIGQKRAITIKIDKCKGLLNGFKTEKDKGSSHSQRNCEGHQRKLDPAHSSCSRRM